MSGKVLVGLVAGAVVVGLLVGLALGAGDDEPSKVNGPGPTDVVSGVPVGYEHSKVGAIRVALNYETALTGAAVKSPATRRVIVDALAVPSRRDSVVNSLEEAFKLVEGNIGSSGFLRGAVVSYRVKAYDSQAAEVELWEVGVIAGQAIPPQATWGTTTLRLRWTSGDWKLAEAPQTADGPTPQLQGTPSDPAVLIASVRQQEAVGYVPAR